MGYAYQVPFSDIYISANIKLINSVIQDYSSFGIAADFGIIYTNEYAPYVFTLTVRNIGAQIPMMEKEKKHP